MKKIFITGIMAILISITLSTPRNAAAADYSIGLYSYYAWWKPSFASLYSNYKMDPGLYVGPAFAVTFSEKWTFSLGIYLPLFMSGELEYDYTGTGGISSTPYTIKIKSESERADIDSTLSYRIDNNIRIFAGYKYMEFDDSDEQTFPESKLTISSPYTKTGNDEWKRTEITSHGPALGASYTIHAAENTALTIGTSMLYTMTKLKNNKYSEVSSGVLGADQVNYAYKGVGNNSTITLSYYMKPASTSISIGGRYQAVKYYGESGAPSLDNDYFYGITASAMYLF